MSSFIIKTILRLLAILIPIALIEWGIGPVLKVSILWLQILYVIGLLIGAISMALAINWVAILIKFDDTDKEK